MATKPKKPFLLRINPKIIAAIERLASDEFRSTNAQMEVLLLDALKRRNIQINDFSQSHEENE